MDKEKKIQELSTRLTYIQDIFENKQNEAVKMLQTRLDEFAARTSSSSQQAFYAQLSSLEELFTFMEHKLDAELTPMDKVRIVRHPQRICLRDILENVYDNYTEIGGQDDKSIDPSMLIARAYVTRRRGKNIYHQPIMVIGQEKGHGEEFRNGGSVKPWGNAKALQYMKVAETENIPIHTYIFTPGSYPIEDYPGAAQQIARNLYEMTNLRVPIITVLSEGGSGGAEAIGLADRRLMLSHGYYSVISPEGGAAIECRLRQGERAKPELIEKCAKHLKITATDNLQFGLIDQIIEEPWLGAKPYHYSFFQTLRQAVLKATDEVTLSTRRFATLRSMALKNQKELKWQKGQKNQSNDYDAENYVVRWSVNSAARNRLVAMRHEKFRGLSKGKFIDGRTNWQRWSINFSQNFIDFRNILKHDFWGRRKKQLSYALEELEAEVGVLINKITSPFKRLLKKNIDQAKQSVATEKQLTTLSDWSNEESRGFNWNYISPLSKEDKSITCTNRNIYGCVDLWAPDLYGEFAGVCTNCGHHFPMEYDWFMYNIFDSNTVQEFNQEIEAGNPLNFEGFEVKLAQAKEKTKLKSACITYEAELDGIKTVVAMLVGNFRGGSVGVAEGEKFLLAAERAQKKRYPFLAYIHGTAGIRIQEGTNGVIQMPRCTIAVRRYLDAGGLYLVVYDTNSYAGPVASFLGCAPYQFAIRSSNVGFAGHGVIKETTGLDIPPDYHSAYKALARGHIQGVWDRRETRVNLRQALLIMGGRNLYYR